MRLKSAPMKTGSNRRPWFQHPKNTNAPVVIRGLKFATGHCLSLFMINLLRLVSRLIITVE